MSPQNSQSQMKHLRLVIYKIIENAAMQVITLLDTSIWANKVTSKYISTDKLSQSSLINRLSIPETYDFWDNFAIANNLLEVTPFKIINMMY